MPNDRCEIQMVAIANIANSKRGMTYNADQLVEPDGGAVAYFNMKSFLKSGGLNTRGIKWFSGNVSPDFLLLESDVIIANTDVTPDSDIIGCATAVPLEYIGRAAFSHHVTRLRVTNKTVSPRFFARALLVERVRRALRAESRGTTVKMLDMTGALAIQVSVLPLNEQLDVVAILDTLDTAIYETEAIIAKLKAVKQGLLHDLLTRGIDANGELRPPQAEAPHLYKQSALGWIPKEWRVAQLAELLAPVDPAMRSGPFGSALLKHELVEVGHPLLGIDNVHIERFVSVHSRFVSSKKFAELARYAVRPADLMITIMGTVGRCCLVPEDVGPALSSKHTWAITLDEEAYSPYLAMLQVNYSPWVLGHFARDQQGGTMAAIRSETLRSTLLPTPPRGEQRLMEQRMREISTRIDLEAESLEKMRAEKLALMDDLLTGRVRVTPLLPPTPA